MSERKSNGSDTVVIEANENDVEHLNDGTVIVNPDDGNGGKPKIVLSRRDRFLRQVGRRVDNAMKRLKQVENLGNRSTYEATEEEYRKVIAVIEDAVDDIRKQFAGGNTRVKGFTL